MSVQIVCNGTPGMVSAYCLSLGTPPDFLGQSIAQAVELIEPAQRCLAFQFVEFDGIDWIARWRPLS